MEGVQFSVFSFQFLKGGPKAEGGLQNRKRVAEYLPKSRNPQIPKSLNPFLLPFPFPPSALPPFHSSGPD